MTNTLAIHGGKPLRTRPFPEWPIFGEVEEQYLLRALRSGKWGRLAGNEVAQFEKSFAEYHQAKHAVAVVNGTVGLRLALIAAGIGEGDEVIVPPYTFLATASAVVEANATPVFADLELDTFNIDPASVESLVTPRTKAVIPVHLGGQAVNLDALLAIAKRHNLVLIEDAAHAHGAEYKGRRVGAIGQMGMFSFQSSKNLCSGEGGIVLTNHDDLAERLRSIHNCGRRVGRAWYEHFTIGGNYRLSEFQGAVLNAQWTRFDEQTTTRDANGKYLAERIARIPGLYPQRRGPEHTPAQLPPVFFPSGGRRVRHVARGADRGPECRRDPVAGRLRHPALPARAVREPGLRSLPRFQAGASGAGLSPDELSQLRDDLLSARRMAGTTPAVGHACGYGRHRRRIGENLRQPRRAGDGQVAFTSSSPGPPAVRRADGASRRRGRTISAAAAASGRWPPA